ncbi:MAG TPA: FixH family protein [Phycisphaerales bacterium]|nr:FixH family protein [Phycisphaerales bacterium]
MSTTTPPAGKSILWPGLIFVFLGLNVAVVGVTIFFAQRYKAAVVDRSFDVTAQHWDEVKAQRDRQAVLGWTCEVSVTESGGSRSLQLHLRDAAGRPIVGARVQVACFHNAHAADTTTLAMSESDGVYTAPMSKMLSGLWTFRVRATTPTEEASFTLERDADSLASVPAVGTGGGA